MSMSSSSGDALEGQVAACERDLRGLARAGEAGVDAELERNVRDLLAQELRLLAALFRQVDGDVGSPLTRFSKFRVDSPCRAIT